VVAGAELLLLPLGILALDVTLIRVDICFDICLARASMKCVGASGQSPSRTI
jgi:hypothetical protein